MQLPSILQGESLTRLSQGIAIGAVATMVIGFYWGGWTLGSTAKEQAQKTATSAVVAALAPICVDKFQVAADSSTNLVELKKVNSCSHKLESIEDLERIEQTYRQQFPHAKLAWVSGWEHGRLIEELS